MKIVLENQSSISAMAPVFFQFRENSDFFPAIVAVTDESLVIYDDQSPDIKDGGQYIYKIKVSIPFEDIKVIIDEKIVNNEFLNKYNRINLINKNVNDSIFVYYIKKEDKYIKKIYKILKSNKVKIKETKTNLDSYE